MSRSTSLFFVLSLILGCILFKVKHEVVEIEQKISKITQQIQREKESIHILKAEWSHLNEPQRLKNLAQKFLDITPMKTNQILAVSRDLDLKDDFARTLPRPHLATMKADE